MNNKYSFRNKLCLINITCCSDSTQSVPSNNSRGELYPENGIISAKSLIISARRLIVNLESINIFSTTASIARQSTTKQSQVGTNTKLTGIVRSKNAINLTKSTNILTINGIILSLLTIPGAINAINLARPIQFSSFSLQFGYQWELFTFISLLVGIFSLLLRNFSLQFSYQWELFTFISLLVRKYLLQVGNFSLLTGFYCVLNSSELLYKNIFSLLKWNVIAPTNLQSGSILGLLTLSRRVY